MPKKRTSVESSGNEHRNEDSDPTLHQGNDAKRAKLSISDAQLKDLPNEMLEYILLRTVAMEVKSMKFAKSAWKEKADLVMKRLQNVCTNWNNILTSKVFRTEVHRILDRTAQGTIRLEILHQLKVKLYVFKVAILKDKTFLFCPQDGQTLYGNAYVINVCERNNTALEVKDVISMRGVQQPYGMEACSVSNCVYVLTAGSVGSSLSSVLRITKDGNNPFKVSTLISGLTMPRPSLSVTANGRLIIASRPPHPNPVIKIYNASGSLRKSILLPSVIYGSEVISRIMQKPDGNLVLVSSRFYLGTTRLTEIDPTGTVVRRYQSRIKDVSNANFSDIYGRIFMCNLRDRIKLVDQELNLLDVTGARLHHTSAVSPPSTAQHSDEWTEAVRTSYSLAKKTTTMTIFRFREI